MKLLGVEQISEPGLAAAEALDVIVEELPYAAARELRPRPWDLRHAAALAGEDGQ